MMPHKDTELDALGDAREQARTVRTEWKEYLDSCHERLSALRHENDSRIDGLSREGDDLYNQMVDSATRSTECYGGGDHRGAGEWSARGKALKARLATVNDEKNGLIAQMKEARAKFNDARDNYRNVKAAHEAAQLAFDDRLAEVKRQKAAKDEARTRRMAAKKPSLVSEAERKAVKKATKTFQFVDDDVRVVFERDFDQDLQTWIASVYVFHRSLEIRGHVHALFREDNGDELMCEYHDDA